MKISARCRRRNDDGAALLLIIGAVTLISVLAVTVGSLSLNNLRNTIRDKQSGSAFATAEAGVAAVIQRIRTGAISLSGLTCIEPTDPAQPLPASCTGAAMSWTSSVNPMQINIDTGLSPCTSSQTCYKVWIGAISPYAPPTVLAGVYRVHSRGLFGNGSAARTVVTDIKVKPSPYPIGVFGEQVSGNGGTSLLNESLFSRACVSPRHTGSGNGTSFTGNDVYWDQPASAHSTTMISSANNCGASGNIHAAADCPENPALNFDQSTYGGPLSASSGCYRTHTRADGSSYPDALPTEGCTPRPDGLCDSTSFTTKDLQRYGYIPRGLTDAQYANLKAQAQSTGTYNVGAASIHSLLTTAYAGGTGVRQPVVYIDCAVAGACSGGKYELRADDFPTVFQQAPDAAPSMARCASGAQPVVTVVVEHGNLEFQGGNDQWIDGAFFVPDGQWRGDGGYNVLGTLFANDLSLGGNETFQLDKCFVRDIPAPLLEVQVVGFREDDARDVS